MAKKLDNWIQMKVASPISNTSGNLASNKIDARGYGRARFTFTFGQPLANASLASAGVWKAPSTSSGGTYVSMPSAALAAITSGAISDVNAVIDTVVDPANAWLQISGAMATSSVYYTCTVMLYNGTRTQGVTNAAQQVISIDTY